mgnify:CR=1 FL=1
MPQLDSVTFFSQYFWLLFFFMVLYGELYYSVLPKLARIIKVRKKQHSTGSLNAVNCNSEKSKISSVTNSILESKNQLQHILKTSSAWSSNVIIQASSKDFLNSNKSYLVNLAKNNLLQNAIIFDLTLISSHNKLGNGTAKEKFYNYKIMQKLFA